MEINEHAEDVSNCTGHFQNPSSIKRLSRYLSTNVTKEPLILCIGTDRCIGDVLAPLTGTILQKLNVDFPVYGTLENPVHALNISNNLKKIKSRHPQAYIIAVDASLGCKNEVGNIIIRRGSLHPGKGVGKKLPAVGDLTIVGIVETFKADIALVIHNIRLHFVMSMAEIIASIIIRGLCQNKSAKDNPYNTKNERKPPIHTCK